ncbi:MAG TPA: hypothetical protein VNQ32_03880 [Steroidobacteraceae bacterium]|nr:hypothetical protein [Steroidobacteraceae bacterium]
MGLLSRVAAPAAACALQALALCAAASLPAVAAQPARPNLSGFWNLAGTPVEDPELKAKIAPGTVILQDTGGPEYGPGDFGGLKLTPAAEAAAKAWNIKDEMTVSATCRIPSIVYAMQGPFPIEIFQGTEMTVIRLEYFDMARVIFTDGRKHMPADAPLTKTGDSIGRWEGDTLVVETIHLKEATITNNGLSHSDKVRVIERFKLSPDGKKLISTQEFEDPEMLQNRGARFITWNKVEGDHVHAYDCDPSFAENYAN